MPTWVALEVFSFGSMSKILEYLADDAPARSLAHSYSMPWEGFRSTVHSLAVLRNRCAHHGQLWHRYLDAQTPVQKKLRRGEPAFDPQGPYAAVIATKRLLKELPDSDVRRGKIQAFFDQKTSLMTGFLSPSPR